MLSVSGSFGDEEIVSSKSAKMSNPAMMAPTTTQTHMQLGGHKTCGSSTLPQGASARLFRWSYDTGQGTRMRTILGLNLVWLAAISTFAQDRNFPAALGAGLPPVRSLGTHFGSAPRPHRGGFPIGPGYGYDYGFDGYGYAAPDVEPPPDTPAVNNVVVLPPAIPPPPPKPIHSFIQNLKGNSEQAAGDQSPAFFVIVLKNGSRLTASAVWVQDNQAHYVDGDGQGHRVPLADVDRTATRELNQTHNLNLRLPPSAQ